MAKGGGGEGHYDERRRAGGLMDVFGTADAPAPRKKAPAKKVVLKSKPKAAVVKPRPKPSRVQTDSNSGEEPGAGTKMTVTRYNTGRLKPQNTGFVSPSVSTLKPQNYGFSGPGPSFGGPTPGGEPDLTQQDNNFMRPDLRPQNTGFVTPTPMERARDRAGGGRRLEDMIDAYLKRARPGGGYP